ncbi:unannotated protein [freshwater metagenome]|uniref:Unannotated protein n=1 Tax=freshwater metagenome TaxID=449393 RepID=A0A6J7GL26_9ZZZZ
MPQAAVLVVYTTTHGHTRHIAEHVVAAATAEGHRARGVATHEADAADPARADALVVVVPVHHGQHDGETMAWLSRERALVDRIPSLVLSVSIAGAGTDDASRAEARTLLAELVLRSNVTPSISASIGGAVDHDGIPLFARAGRRDEAERHGLPADAEHDTVLTDWGALDVLEHRFLDLLRGSTGGGPAGSRTVPSPAPLPATAHPTAGLGTRHASGRSRAAPGTGPGATSPFPELSEGVVRITCRPLTDPARLRELVAGVTSIPGVGAVALDSVAGDHAILRLDLERPVALGAELVTHLARQISACRTRDGLLEVELLPHPAASPPRTTGPVTAVTDPRA